MYDIRSGYIVIISGAVVLFLRCLPFIAFRNRTPKFIIYLGRVLPYSVMSMLVVYCLRYVKIFSGSHGIPEAVSCLLVVVLHVWKRNTLLSILAGTLMYMLLVQYVF